MARARVRAADDLNSAAGRRRRRPRLSTNATRSSLIATLALSSMLMVTAGCGSLSPVGGAADSVDSYLRDRDFSGAVLVARGDEVVLDRGYGTSSLTGGEPITADTVFPIMSITKPFTAVATLQLQERGRLDVHDRVAAYLPGFPHAERFTIEQLLTHTSGLPRHMSSSREPLAASAAPSTYSGAPLEFEPGTGYGYSNAGYQLLAAIVELTSGQPFDDYLQQAIFDPAGMTDSGVAVTPLHQDDLPRGHSRIAGHAVEVSSFDDAAATQIGAGGIYSTTNDMLAWERALRTGALLDDASRDQMFAAHVEVEHDQAPAWGYGWAILDPGRSMWHFGGDLGFSAFFLRDLDRDLVVVVLSNTDDHEPVTDLLSLYRRSHDLEGAWWFAGLPWLTTTAAIGAAVWLLWMARSVRRHERVLGRPRLVRTLGQIVLPVVAGLVLVAFNLTPVWQVGSASLVTHVAPAWPPIMAASFVLLFLALTVAVHAFLRRPQASAGKADGQPDGNLEPDHG